MFGGALMDARLEIFFFMLLAAYIGSNAFIQRGTLAIGLSSLFLFAGISDIRTSVIKKTSDAVTDFLSVREYLKPYSVVLPLNFAPNGIDLQGRVLTSMNWIFTHAQEYNGIYMPLIMLDNYEANTDYFPLRWNEDLNPFFHLCRGNGIEAYQPYAVIDQYRNIQKVRIDYIVMRGYAAERITDNDTRKLVEEINRDYKIVYRSPGNLTILYAYNGPPIP